MDQLIRLTIVSHINHYIFFGNIISQMAGSITSEHSIDKLHASTAANVMLHYLIVLAVYRDFVFSVTF